jgi:hypothetical protein
VGKDPLTNRLCSKNQQIIELTGNFQGSALSDLKNAKIGVKLSKIL